MVVEVGLSKQQRIRRRLEPYWYPISATAIAAYDPEVGGCPAAFKRYHLDREPEPYNAAGEFGKALHAGIQAILNGEAKPRYNGPLTYVDEWINQMALFRDVVRPQLSTTGTPEQELLHEWQDGDVRVQLRGLVDYLTLDGSVGYGEEFKSGWKVARLSEIEFNLQLRIYDLLVKRTCPWLAETAWRLWPFRFNGKPRPVAFTTGQTDQFEEFLRDFVHRMMADTTFAPNPSCVICPPGSHVTALTTSTVTFPGFDVALTEPETPERASQLATAVRILEKMTEAGKDALKLYAKQHGPVPVLNGGGFYGHFEQRRKVIANTEQALAIVKAARPDDWQEFAGLNLTACRPLLETKKNGIPELQALVVYEPESRFEWKANLPVKEAS